MKREIVKVAGQTVYQRLYEWNKNWNFLQVLDELGGWRAVMGLDDSGRLISINTMAGTGPNPFPWPVGLTTVTTDANGAIRALQNGNWRAECDVDYEGRLTEIRWPGYPYVRLVYDGIGRKLKELQIDPNSGQVIKESRFVLDGETPVQERDAQNNKVEEYAHDGGRLLRRKVEATGEKQWTQSQISGTPVRIVDDGRNVTGGMIWTREGEKAAGVNDTSYPFGCDRSPAEEIPMGFIGRMVNVSRAALLPERVPAIA